MKYYPGSCSAVIASHVFYLHELGETILLAEEFLYSQYYFFTEEFVDTERGKKCSLWTQTYFRLSFSPTAGNTSAFAG